MSHYNAWQNKQLSSIIEVMDEDALTADRGAFFGSILGTLNHLLWCDQLWLSRFDTALPGPSGPDTQLCPSGAAWFQARKVCDKAIVDWAQGLDQSNLNAELSWFSGILQCEVTKPGAQCVMHFFNHQTHHRGQVHAMLTAAGQEAPVTDLIFMPEDV
ncbi:DinB family protein [Sulfitobacter sp. DSM 110093]|uniref:DinB family protein n=1 Tax=Sulfitobacter sp. DSM 110093 TaxID=2883127 RepID=UPI001FAC4DB9|nr:DinB family protein [Sulfitobacter sp. DSM 110093]